MPLLEAPTNFDDESSPENSLAAELGGDLGGVGGNHHLPVAGQLRIRSPEPFVLPNARVVNNFGGIRLPTIRLHNQHTFAQAQAAAAAAHSPATAPILIRRGDIFAELEAEAFTGLAPPPVVNLLPVSLPPQVAEPQLDELLRRVTQRTDLHNVETVRLRVISAITVSLSRLAMFLPRLQHLDLSGSVLYSLRDLGCGLIHLAHLNVSNCGLNSFDGTSGMPSVRVLIADGNMIQRVGPLTQLPLLQRLSAQNNRISDLSLLTFLAMCPNLTELELQGNPVCHLRLYRHTLQRSVRSLRLIDGQPVVADTEQEDEEVATTSATTEANRVAALNRRNALLSHPTTSINSIASNHSSSSISSSNSLANTISDNEDISSLSSEYQVAIDEPSEEPLANERQRESAVTESQWIPTNRNSEESSPLYSSATSDGLENESGIRANTINSLLAVAPIRHLRRPATAPVENSLVIGATEITANNNRPASATTLSQRVLLPPGTSTGSSILAGSMLDLVRQRRRRFRRNHCAAHAWMSDSSGSNSTTSSSVLGTPSIPSSHSSEPPRSEAETADSSC